MRNVLLPSNGRILEEFSASNVLVALDFDGTLAPLVADPERARMRGSTARLLDSLASLYPCVVISGRAKADVSGRLLGIPLRAVIGNHGAEPWGTSRNLRKKVESWKPLLEERLSRIPGVKIEDKGYSIAVHYRGSREKAKALEAIRQATSLLDKARVGGGAQVVNVVPKGAPHKGIALERERERLACDAAIYVGDDDTDEDVFRLDQPERLLSIRVGPSSHSRAPYYVPSQAEVDGLLRVLVRLRRRSMPSLKTRAAR